MDALNRTAAGLTGRARSYALSAACGVLVACAHLPPLIRSRDALSAQEHARLGAAYEAQGLSQEAEKEYLAAVKRDPGETPAWMALGNAHFNAGDLKDAERCYRRVLKIDPRHAGAANNLAMAYLARDERLPEAERLAREALGRDEALKPYILDTLAHIYARQARYDEAMAALRQAEAASAGDNALLERLKQTRAALERRAG